MSTSELLNEARIWKQGHTGANEGDLCNHLREFDPSFQAFTMPDGFFRTLHVIATNLWFAQTNFFKMRGIVHEFDYVEPEEKEE